MPITPGPSGKTPFVQAVTQTSSASTKVQPTTNSGAYTYYPQPFFDTRIYALTFPMGGARNSIVNGGLTRGYMVWANAMTTGGYGSQKAALNFLYNPTTVTASYAVDGTDLSSTQMYRQPLDQATALYGMNQSVSFSLLFDRTFEMWGAYAPAGSGGVGNPKQSAANGGNITNPSVIGVEADVIALKQLTGMLINAQSNAQQGVTNSQGAKSTVSPIASTQGPMMLIPIWLFFGNVTGGLSYYGYVSDWSVTYTHFSQYMVPMRCAVDIDFTLLMPPGGAQAQQSLGQAKFSNNAWTQAQLGNVQDGVSSSNPFGVIASPVTTGQAGR